MGELYRLDFANGKSYVGITTKRSSQRFFKHRRLGLGGGRRSLTPLYNAWKKHGEPKLVVLAILEDKDLAETEVRAIKAYGTLYPNGYNLTEGGEVSPMTNALVVQKVRQTLATPASKAKRSATQKLLCTEEERQVRSRRLKGRSLAEETKKKLSVSHTGKTQSEESRKKIGVASAAYWQRVREARSNE